MIHTEQPLRADRRPQMSKKTRKPPNKRVGQTEKEKEGNRLRPVPQGGICEGGNVPPTWEVSSPVGSSAWTECSFRA